MDGAASGKHYDLAQMEYYKVEAVRRIVRQSATLPSRGADFRLRANSSAYRQSPTRHAFQTLVSVRFACVLVLPAAAV